MASRTCYFCDRPLRPILIGNRTVLPGYCFACGQQKDQELGQGWQQEPWAKFLFADVSREVYANDREAQHTRLDELSETAAASIPSLPVASQTPSERQAIYQLFCSSKLGARRLQRALAEAGEERSLWQVQEALRTAMREGLRQN